jgi:hypothetical protein
MNVLSKVGNKLAYTSKQTGEIVAEFRKNWTEEKLMQIMLEWDESSIQTVSSQVDTSEEE